MLSKTQYSLLNHNRLKYWYLGAKPKACTSCHLPNSCKCGSPLGVRVWLIVGQWLGDSPRDGICLWGGHSYLDQNDMKKSSLFRFFSFQLKQSPATGHQELQKQLCYHSISFFVVRLQCSSPRTTLVSKWSPGKTFSFETNLSCSIPLPLWIYMFYICLFISQWWNLRLEYDLRINRDGKHGLFDSSLFSLVR